MSLKSAMGAVCFAGVAGLPGRTILLASLAATLLATACTFDRSRLDTLQCSRNSDCLSGQCLEGYCVEVGRPSFDRDLGSDVGQADVAETDADADLPDTPPDSIVDIRDETPGCTTTNACGGCAALSGVPGEACTESTCGTWACDGLDALTCEPGPANACGGCTVLEQELGDPCECDGELVCDGTDSLTCSGSVLNVCGGCGGPVGVVGDPCECTVELAEPEHQWTCEADRLACRDSNNSADLAVELPGVTDTMTQPRVAEGSLVDGETDDWFVIEVTDENAFDGMYPDLQLTGLDRDHDLCAYFQYADGTVPDLRCSFGQEDTFDDMPGCCSRNSGNTMEIIALRNSDPWTDRFDTEIGAENDNAVVLIHVSGEPGEGCETYELGYQF